MSDEPLPQSEIIFYQTEDGRTRVQCRFENETVWLTQQQMAELFQTTKQNVGQHLKSLFTEGELVQDSVVKESFTTAADGKNYATRFYNLDVIISVGYRVKSLRGTQFRIWATQRLREYIVKGFTMDDERLKIPPNRGCEAVACGAAFHRGHRTGEAVGERQTCEKEKALSPDNPLALSFPRRRESNKINSPRSGQNLDIDPLRGDFSIDWIPACAGMTSFGANGLFGLNDESFVPIRNHPLRGEEEPTRVATCKDALHVRAEGRRAVMRASKQYTTPKESHV